VEMAENQDWVDYVKVAEGFGCYGERVFDAATSPPPWRAPSRAANPPSST
jgi:tartronate-semialdehyde synthase